MKLQERNNVAVLSEIFSAVTIHCKRDIFIGVLLNQKRITFIYNQMSHFIEGNQHFSI